MTLLCPHDALPCERARRCSLTIAESCANLHSKLERTGKPTPCDDCRAKRKGACKGYHCLVAWSRSPEGRISRDLESSERL